MNEGAEKTLSGEYRIPNSQKNEVKMVGTRFQDFELIDEIGRGSHGIVYKVKSKLDGEIYAMKVINLLKLKKRTLKGLRSEGTFLQKLKHQNIIKCFEVFEEKNKIFMILEFAERKDLHQVD